MIGPGSIKICLYPGCWRTFQEDWLGKDKKENPSERSERTGKLDRRFQHWLCSAEWRTARAKQVACHPVEW